MEKMQLIADVAEKLIVVAKDIKSLADSVEALCNVVVRCLSENEEKVATPKKTAPSITLEKVRGALALKSQQGFKAEVKEVIAKYGATRLSEIDPQSYASLLKDAEAIGNE